MQSELFSSSSTQHTPGAIKVKSFALCSDAFIKSGGGPGSDAVSGASNLYACDEDGLPVSKKCSASIHLLRHYHHHPPLWHTFVYV